MRASGPMKSVKPDTMSLPRMTASERALLLRYKAANYQTPGPGAYDGPAVRGKDPFRDIAQKDVINSSQFSSRVNRFYHRAPNAGMPGPGAYDPSDPETLAVRLVSPEKGQPTSSFLKPASIERAKDFLAQSVSLDTHLQRMQSYLPVAEGITSGQQALEQCLAEHPIEKLVCEDCSVVLDTLTPLLQRFHSQFETMLNLDFDPSDSLRCMEDGSKTLLEVDGAFLVPLPPGTKCLSLYLWGILDTLATATMSLLTVLSEAKNKAQALLTRLEGEGEEVTDRDLDLAEETMGILKVKLGRRTLSDEEREALGVKLAAATAKVATLEAKMSSRSEITNQLRPFLLFPEVAEALGQPLRERQIDTSRNQHPCDWGEGYIVTENGLVEGEQNLVNPYAIVDKTNLDLTSDDFKDEDVTSWDLTGSRVTGVDMRGVEGVTVEHIGSLSSITQCNLSGMSLKSVDLSGTDVTGSDFSDADLGACDVSGATLSDCDFSRARLGNVRGLTLEQLGSVRSLNGAVISGVDMRGWGMEGARVKDIMVVGTTLPQNGTGPTVIASVPRFEVAQGVTETVVSVGSLPLQGSQLNPVTLLIPSVEGTKSWTLTAPTALQLKVDSANLFWGHRGVATCTRSGSTITFEGVYSRTYPCTQGQEARVPLQFNTSPTRLGTLTLAPQ
ncbi:hypothetical protein KIPB_006673 [Kipferlia bialata]|uniref:Pentapeptide repeat-containing protein n=1 Tax=Kipferlia bialata TaxID=797122 RepID=A0A9K3GJZ5_9EUKA|nr:hypothetical protein KIPB_006673 [Kipferlia bialata]|eukprot:g6673.t1